MAGAVLSWRWTLGEHDVVGELETTSGVESVRLDRRLVSRSAVGGMPEGHSFPIDRKGEAEPGAPPFRAAASAEIHVRFDPRTRTCVLTSNGAVVAPISAPPPVKDVASSPSTGSRWPTILFALAGAALALYFGSKLVAARQADHFSACVAENDVACATEQLALLRTLQKDRYRLEIAVGQLQALEGNTKEATEHLRSIELNAKLDATGTAELELLRGDVAAAGGDPDGAREHWNKALPTLPPTVVEPGRIRRLEDLKKRSVEAAGELRPLLDELFAAIAGGTDFSAEKTKEIETKTALLQGTGAQAKVRQGIAGAMQYRSSGWRGPGEFVAPAYRGDPRLDRYGNGRQAQGEADYAAFAAGREAMQRGATSRIEDARATAEEGLALASR